MTAYLPFSAFVVLNLLVRLVFKLIVCCSYVELLSKFAPHELVEFLQLYSP
jgi:hypothetical protein